MSSSSTVALCLVAVAALVVAAGSSQPFISQQPEDPIMGILSQPNPHPWANICGEYVQQTYVEWLAAGGARSVPVHYYGSRNESTKAALREQLSHLNGVLFTGGGLDFHKSKEFYDTAKMVYEYTVEQNEAGNPFVLWGTCQGFQLISVIAAGSNFSGLLECNYVGTEPAMFPLNLTAGAFDNSRFFSMLNESSPLLPFDITQKDSTANLHHCGVSPRNWFYNPGLYKNFTILSTNDDVTGHEFVSTYEHNKYEIYGSQWHPEGAQFWYGLGLNKKPSTLRVSTYAANFVTSRLRRTNGSFPPSPSVANATWLHTLLTQYPIVENPPDQNVGFYCVGDMKTV